MRNVKGEVVGLFEVNHYINDSCPQTLTSYFGRKPFSGCDSAGQAVDVETESLKSFFSFVCVCFVCWKTFKLNGFKLEP